MKEKRIIFSIIVVALLIIGYFSARYIRNTMDRGKISASGTIEVVEINIGAKIDGKIKELLVDEGDDVKSGQVMAKIHAPEIDSQYKAAKAAAECVKIKYENACDDFARIENLYEKGMASEQQYYAAKSLSESLKKQFEQANALAESAKTYLDYTIIYSPLNGTVLTKVIENGELISAGSTLFTVADLTTLELKIYVPETQIGKINLKDKVLVIVDSFPGEKFEGRVKFISQQAEFTPKNIQTKEERVNQVYEIKVKIPNKDLKLKPGMPADAVIEIS